VKKPRPIVLAVVSDIHAGSTVAICPPRVALDDGANYEASKAQQWLWQCWEQYWAHVDAVRCEHSADLYAVFNGDLVEGNHHGTTQILSGNPNAQAAVVTACMAVPLALKPSRLFFIRGTDAHVGQSASAEERIADGLRRDKRPVVGDAATGTASQWHLRMELHGHLIDVAHHGRTGQREHTRQSAAVLHAHDILLAHVKNGDRYPDLCLRGHYHKFNDSHDAAPTRVVTTGAWQLATSHVHKVATDSLADIGGAIVTLSPGVIPDVEKVHFKAQREEPWRP
jgi:hypothetical protein